MKKTNLTGCIACKSKKYKIIFSYDEPDQYEKIVGLDTEGYFRKWVKCDNCELYYSVYSRDKKFMDKIYKSEYRNLNSPWRNESPEMKFKKIIELPESESENKYRIRWIKDNINEMLTQNILEKMETPHKLLDIGGGNGVFAYEFQDNNWKSYIVDPDENGKFVKSYSIEFSQNYYNSGIFNTKFNLISLVFVLEHINKPIDLLKKVKRDMASGSLLYIEVPDAICFKKKTKTDDIFNSCHLWMFSPKTLTLILDECGFEIFSLKRVRTKRGHYSIMALAGKKQLKDKTKRDN